MVFLNYRCINDNILESIIAMRPSSLSICKDIEYYTLSITVFLNHKYVEHRNGRS